MWIIKILKKYNIEPILFFYYTASLLYYPTPFTKLAEDKVCIHKYNLSYDFCYNINRKENAETPEATKITTDAAHYIMYRTLIISIPSIFAALFIGPWLDQHKIAPKIVLVATSFAGLFEAVCVLFCIIFFESDSSFLLISPILSGITGGEILFITACFLYAVKETPLEDRTFRFVILELFMIIPSPAANLISSFVLPMEPYFKNQIRNYLPLMSIAISFYLICFIFIIFVIGKPNEVYSEDDTVLKRASIRTSIQPFSKEYLTIKNQTRSEPDAQYVNKAYENDINISTISSSNHSIRKVSFKNTHLSEKIHKKASNSEIFKSLFKLNNAIEIFRSVVKKREDKVHRMLWMVICVYLNQLVNTYGMVLIMVLFVERAYKWELGDFQQYESAGATLIGFATTFAVYYSHKIQLEDTKVIAFGIASLFSLCFFKGIILNPTGYILSYVFGGCLLCGLVGCRGFVTKIIPESELGSVLCALSVIYAASPVFASLIYTKIFTSTLDYYPGTVFLFASFVIFINMLVLIFLHFKYTSYKTKINNKQLTS